ncbi:MAG: FHA domain-containing protein [Phycisphaerales bacterium]|nr:FHA domain-containing protein [Phycisphaerales bacterium]
MATLVVVQGPASGSKFALEGHRLIMVGRDQRCTFQVVDPTMSRMHLQLRFDADHNRHFAIDFQSRHGVYVNDAKIEAETPLKHGDKVRLGESMIVYSTDDSPEALRCFEAAHRMWEGHIQTRTDVQEND